MMAIQLLKITKFKQALINDACLHFKIEHWLMLRQTRSLFNHLIMENEIFLHQHRFYQWGSEINQACIRRARKDCKHVN